MVELPRTKNFETPSKEAVTPLPVPPAPGASKTKPAKGVLKRGLLLTALLGATAYAGDFGYRYWTVGRFIVSTDNAYLKADYTTVAPKIAGYVTEVLVNDNDVVKAGQILARIDDRDFQISVRQASADVNAANAAIKNIDAQIELQGSVIQQARASREGSTATLIYARSDAARNARLNTNGAGTLSRAEQSRSLMEQASAAVERDYAALVSAQKKIPVLKSEREKAVAQRDRAVAMASQARLNLSYTEIVAAVDGTVGARSIRVGQFVTAGTQLMAVVPLHSVYVVANYKETQLTDVRPGQSVDVRVDSFPDLKVEGHVDSLSPASGLEFSLLPPDNATGNFTKIVQRIPVKIIINHEDVPGQLRSGMSVKPEIDTRSGSDKRAD